MDLNLLQSIESQNTKSQFTITLNKVSQITFQITQNLMESSKNKNSNFQGFSLNQFQNLKIVRKMGEGAFSEVFHAIDEETNKEFAIRLTKIDNIKYTIQKALREIKVVELMKHFSHQNITKIYHCNLINENDISYLQIILELGTCTLEEIFQKRQKTSSFWTENEILKIAYGLISALKLLNEYGLQHRDISLNNIILSKDMDEYKLIDFGEGLVFIENQEDLPVVGKFYFMAPEIFEIVQKIQKNELNGIKLDYDAEKVDVFSLGIVLMDLCLLNKINASCFEEIELNLHKIDQNYPKVIKLLKEMLSINPNLRKSFSSLYLFISNWDAQIGQTIYTEMNYANLFQPQSKLISFQEILIEADFNKKCRMFREAIEKYIKAFKLIKGNEKVKKEEQFLVQITFKIASCQKNLLNYELAGNILKTLYDKEKQKTEIDSKMILLIIYEYSEILLLSFKYKEAYDIISKGMKKIDQTALKNEELKKTFSKLILLKTIILLNLGYLKDSANLFKKLEKFFQQNNKYIYLIEFLKLNLYECKFEQFLELYNKLLEESETKIFNGNKEIFQQKLFIIKLEYEYQINNFQEVQKILDKISDLFSSYDQLMLVRNKEFLEFIRYKILLQIQNHKYKTALIRVDNILNSFETNFNKYYQIVFTLVKIEILRKMNKFSDSLSLAEKALELIGIQDFANEQLKNFQFFKKLHLEMGISYYYQFQFKNAMKCFKYILLEYYEKPQYFSQENFIDLDLCKIYLWIAKINRKIGEIPKYEKYLSKSESLYISLFPDKIPNCFLKLYFEQFKFNKMLNRQNVAQGFLDKQEHIIKKMYEKSHLFFNTALFYVNMGKMSKQKGDLENCLKYFREAATITQQALDTQKDPRMIKITQQMIKMCIKFEQFPIAVNYLKICSEISQIFKDKYSYAQILILKGFFLKKKFEFEKAIQKFHKAKKLFSQIYDNQFSLEALDCEYQVGRCFEMQKNYSDALSIFEECFFHYKKIFKNYSYKIKSKCKEKIKKLSSITMKNDSLIN